MHQEEGARTGVINASPGEISADGATRDAIHVKRVGDEDLSSFFHRLKANSDEKLDP